MMSADLTTERRGKLLASGQSEQLTCSSVFKLFVVLCRQTCITLEEVVLVVVVVVVLLSLAPSFHHFTWWVTHIIISHPSDLEHLHPTSSVIEAGFSPYFSLLWRLSLRGTLHQPPPQHPRHASTWASLAAVAESAHSVQPGRQAACSTGRNANTKANLGEELQGFRKGNGQHSLLMGTQLIDKMLFIGDRIISLSVRTSLSLS